jgi:hypothetical protein
MIVKKEAATLGRCLASVRDIVDEIIVVDTGSSDNTKDIARQYSARVFDLPWPDSFVAARNESLCHATGQWLLWLDADFNLGWAYADLGRMAEAIPLLERSLHYSHNADSITPNLYTLLTQCHLRLGQFAQAWTVCQAGQMACPRWRDGDVDCTGTGTGGYNDIIRCPASVGRAAILLWLGWHARAVHSGRCVSRTDEAWQVWGVYPANKGL